MEKNSQVCVKSNKRQIYSVKSYFSKKNWKMNSCMLFLNNPWEHEYTKKVFMEVQKIDELFGKVDLQDLPTQLVGIWLTLDEYVVKVEAKE